MPQSPKKILLTGARGRLASCLAPFLQSMGYDLQGFSHKAVPDLRALLNGPALENSDTLLHLAWSTLPATSEANIGVEWETDLPLLIKLLRRIVESPARERLHFIFFSSGGSVYGTNQGRPSVETDTCHPIGWYAQAKVAAEEIIQIFGKRHGLKYTILRVSNPYGFPLPPERAQGIIPRALQCALHGQTLNLWGDGSAQKDFLHYHDFNRAVEAVIALQLTGIYNLSAGISWSIHDMLKEVEKLTQRKIAVICGASQPWDVQISKINRSKLSQASGWSPKISLAEGLRLSLQALHETQ